MVYSIHAHNLSWGTAVMRTEYGFLFPRKKFMIVCLDLFTILILIYVVLENEFEAL